MHTAPEDGIKLFMHLSVSFQKLFVVGYIWKCLIYALTRARGAQLRACTQKKELATVLPPAIPLTEATHICSIKSPEIQKQPAFFVWATRPACTCQRRYTEAAPLIILFAFQIFLTAHRRLGRDTYSHLFEPVITICMYVPTVPMAVCEIEYRFAIAQPGNQVKWYPAG